MPDIRQQVFGPIATGSSTDPCVALDAGRLLQWLLLFDTVIIESRRLREVPLLIEAFGYAGVVALLESGAVRIHCDVSTIGQLDNPTFTTRGQGRVVIGPLRYGIVRMANHNTFIDRSISEFRRASGITTGRAQKIENLIRGRLIRWDPAAREQAFEQTKQEIASQSSPVMRAIRLAAARLVPGHTDWPSCRLTVVERSDGGYEVDTDIPGVWGLNSEQATKIVSAGLLGVGGLNCVVEDMQTHSALVGLQPNDLPVFEDKLAFLRAQMDPTEQGERLSRICELTGLPDLSQREAAANVDVPRLLAIRSSDECRAFRTWLWSSGDLTADEIAEQYAGLREQLRSFVRSNPGKGLRWMASTAAGLIPGVGPVLGAGLGFLDTFLAEEVVRKPGAISFLSHQYSSIFK